MKNIFYNSILFAAFFLTINACQKEITTNFSDLGELIPSKLDTTAGNWKTIVLATNEEVVLAAPTAINSAEYQAELAETKRILTSLTQEQKDAIDYWKAGSVLRWNQIMRELVAKYNLPIAPNDDNSYTVPNADSTKNNPFYYPAFPFANPPYAARAYAYVSVAQYDALIAATHYRIKYNRPTPYQVDATLLPLVTKNNLAAYPCEEAVVAGAAFNALLALFPGEKAYLEAKANEAAYFKQWAGAAVASDITAGFQLGKDIATKVIGRAKTDNMKTAGGNQMLWDSLELRIVTLGEIPWKSQDSPTRPPMLPFFGKVKPWLFPSSELPNIRPVAPVSTNSAAFKAQLAEVKAIADPKDREKFRIVHFWADGAGTATPPGHWNSIAFSHILEAQYSEVRTARTFALLNMVEMDAAIACWEAKYHYYLPRPSQMDATIKTLTGLPNFPSYTSGHSTFSGAASILLGHLFPAHATDFEEMAEEASISRLYGGIHYRMDCDAGLLAGKKVGQYAVERAKMDGGE
jgi:membrane-associated phospholipid phosphatase